MGTHSTGGASRYACVPESAFRRGSGWLLCSVCFHLQVDLQRRTVVWLRKWLFHAKVGGVSAERKHEIGTPRTARLGMAQSLVGTNGKYRRQYR